MFRPILAIIRFFLQLLTVITLPINYYTQREWHISELRVFLSVLLVRIAVIAL